MGISIWQLLIVLAVIILLFGTKKLRNLGGDLGTAVKGFKNAMDDDANKKDADFKPELEEQQQQSVEQPQESKKVD